MAEKFEQHKTILRFSGKEINGKHLIDLLRVSGLPVTLTAMRDPRVGAEKRITEDFFPAIEAHIEIAAPYEQVRKVLESSEEFRDHVNNLLGTV